MDNDEVKVEFNPDRTDLFSFTTLSGAMDVYLSRKPQMFLDVSPTNVDFKVTEEALSLRPYITTFIARGPEIGQRFRDLIDFQERIHQSIGKDRSKVSIGIHDMRSLHPPFHYVARERTHEFVPYDSETQMTVQSILEKHEKGRTYGYLLGDSETVPIIEDSHQTVLSMPPVINGKASIVTEKTSAFFVDVTGTDSRTVIASLFCLLYFFQESGYQLRWVNQNGGIKWGSVKRFDARPVRLRIRELEEIVGSRTTSRDVSRYLRMMGYSVRAAKAKSDIEVLVPGNRFDVMGESDLIEDIAKSYGYDNIENVKPALNMIGGLREGTRLKDRIRELAIGLGFQEIMTFVVTSPAFYGDSAQGSGVEIMNPKSVDYSVVRDRLYTNVLDLFRINKHRQLPQHLFEVGDVIIGTKQISRVCFAMASTRTNFSQAKQFLDAVLLRFGITEYYVRGKTDPDFIAGRFGSIIAAEQDFGFIGEVHPETLTRFELGYPVALFELDLSALSGAP